MPFNKGQSGNPQGRPRKGLAMTDLIVKALNKKRGDTAAKIQVVNKLIDLAIEGDPVCIRYLIDRIDGRTRESINLSTSGELDMKLNMILNGETHGN